MNLRAKIYTRSGDAGDTGLPGGRRLRKDHRLLEALGTLDELNSAIGVVLAQPVPDGIGETLQRIQRRLLDLGAGLAVGNVAIPDAGEVHWMETRIDDLSADLPALADFILPGGAAAGAACHLARSVCRRAERRWVAAQAPAAGVKYLNRLSDLLFVTARYLNQDAGRPESPWKTGD